MTNIDALKAEAAQLGIDVDKRWGETRIQAEIQAKKAELALAEKPDGDQNANVVEQVKTDQAEKPDTETDAKNTAEADLKARIAELEAEVLAAKEANTGSGGTGETGDQEVKPTGIVVKNISKNPTWVTGSLRCAPGESAIVSGRELDQCRRKIENGVKHGLLEVVE